MVSSLSAWPGSARLLRETGLLEQLLGIHASETAGPASTSTARAVLVRMAVHDAESARRVHDEILSKVAFVLPRHRGLDVRGLLQQDLLLLRSLCLSPTAALAAVVLAGDNGGGDGDGDGEAEESGEGGAAAARVASCWRLHVGLLLDILRRIPAAADDSVAMVNHVALPCLETVAALCLDGTDYPALQEEAGDEDEDEQRPAGTRAAAASASAPAPGDELVRAGGGRVEDVLLCEILGASAGSWTRWSASADRGGAPGVEWTTPAQARRRAEQAGSAGAAPAIGEHRAPGTAGSSVWGLEGAGAGAGFGSLRAAPRSSRRFFPNHWLLRLMASRQSPVLRTFTGMVIGALAAFKGPGTSKEVAEVAAHLMGVGGAEGSEAAGLQVLPYVVCLLWSSHGFCACERD